MVQCIKCNEFTNILKGLKAVQVNLKVFWDFFKEKYYNATFNAGYGYS